MHLYADAFGRMCMHSYAFLCLQVSHEDPLQPVVLGGLHLGAAHLRGNAADVLGLDAAVLVAQLRVLILLQGVHLLDLLRGLAAGDDALVELLEKGVVVVLLLFLLLPAELLGTGKLLEGEDLLHRVGLRGPEVGRLLVASDHELARQAAVVGLRFVAAAAARLRRRPVFRVADVVQGVPGMDHTDEMALYDRANASLTKDQKAQFKLQKACPGATASFIMKKDQQDALQAGARRNSGEEETGVDGVAALEAYQNQARYLKRAGKLAMRSAPKLENRSDLLNFMRANPLPATLEEMEELKTYTVDGIAAIWDMFEEADGSKVSLFERFRTHSNAFERIRTHSNAFKRV